MAAWDAIPVCWSLVVAQADNPSVIDGDTGFMDFAAENVDETSVSEEKFGRSFTPGDGQLVSKIAHINPFYRIMRTDRNSMMFGCLGLGAAPTAVPL